MLRLNSQKVVIPLCGFVPEFVVLLCVMGCFSFCVLLVEVTGEATEKKNTTRGTKTCRLHVQSVLYCV